MTLNLTGPGFTTELDASPKSITVSGQALGHIGFTFGDFAYHEEGRAKVWVDGVQIGACLSPMGVSMAHDGQRFEFEGDTIIARTPGSVSEARWRDGFHGRFLTYAPEAIERFFHMPLSRIDFEGRDIVQPIAIRPVIGHLLAAVSTDLAAGNPGGATFTESLSAAALRSIIQLPAELKRPMRGLGPEQSKALRELIHERSAEPLSLVDLAGAVDLSIGHMLRAFKATFGVTPHQYIIRERVECAVRFLKTTAMSLDEVARESGFANKAQMARTFRGLLGVLPKDMRS